MEDQNQNSPEVTTKIAKVSFQLFAYMQRCRLHATFGPHPDKLLTYQFVINDMSDTGTPFGISFDLSTSDIEDVEDTPQGIEAFCFGMTVKTGTALLTEKATRLLQYAEEPAKSRIILPGQ